MNNSQSSGHVTKVLQIIASLVNILEEWLDFDIVYENDVLEDQVTITLTQLKHWFDFVASGITHIGLPPRYPDFDPDDYFGGGGSGGSDGDDRYIGEGASNNIDPSSLFAGYNITTTNTEDTL